MRKNIVLLKILVVISFLWIFLNFNVFAGVDHCEENYANSMTNTCNGVVYPVVWWQIKCAKDVEFDTMFCTKSHGVCVDRNDTSTWYNNHYFTDNTVVEYSSFFRFVDLYDLRFSNYNLDFWQVRDFQEVMNDLAYFGYLFPDKLVAGDCNYICEDAKLGNWTINNIVDCLLACQDDERMPVYNDGEFFCGSELLSDELLWADWCCVCPFPERRPQSQWWTSNCSDDQLDSQLCCPGSCNVNPAQLDDNGCCIPVENDFDVINEYCLGLDWMSLESFDLEFWKNGCEVCGIYWDENSGDFFRKKSDICDQTVDGVDFFPFCGKFPSCNVNPARFVNWSDSECCVEWNSNIVSECFNFSSLNFNRLDYDDFSKWCELCKILPDGTRDQDCLDINKESVPFCGEFPEIIACVEPADTQLKDPITNMLEDCCVKREKENIEKCLGLDWISDSDFLNFDFTKWCFLCPIGSDYERFECEASELQKYNFCPKECPIFTENNVNNPEECCVPVEQIDVCLNYIVLDEENLEWEQCLMEILDLDLDIESEEYFPLCPYTQNVPEDEEEIEQNKTNPCALITQEMLDDCTCGMKLNTVVPFIGDCIQFGGNIEPGARSENTTIVGPNTAFPVLMAGLSKIVVTAILVFSFLLVVVAGVIMTTGWVDEGNFSKGKQLIMKVFAGLALLWASGIILKLVNPSFFG